MHVAPREPHELKSHSPAAEVAAVIAATACCQADLRHQLSPSRFGSALGLGDVKALDQLWSELGFDGLGAVFRRACYATSVEHALRVMVFNRLCDPDSKLGVLRWLQTVSMPGVDTAKLTHQQLLRSMDALMDRQDAVDDCMAGLLRPLIDDELSVVFYDLTTIRAEGLSEQAGGVRRFGMSKEGLIARQFKLGVVQTADGMPIYYEVFAGNASEALTFKPTLEKVLARHPPFFGRLKTEMFFSRDWLSTTIEEFVAALDLYIRWYNEAPIKISLGGLSPAAHRRSLGIAV